MKRNKKSFIVLAMVLIALFVIPYSVKAWYTYTIVLQDWDLVDSGKHLDYTNKSKYTSYINQGINTWESYKSGIIRQDTAAIINDVTFSDVSSLGTDAAGNAIVGQTRGIGTIKFATSFMDTFSNAQKLNVVIHEIGHALRLDHRNESDSIMYPSVTNITTLSIGDQRNYDSAYNEY